MTGVFGYAYFRWIHFPSAGRTYGVCVEVRTVNSVNDSNPYNNQMRGRDTRRYIPYIKYEWEGREYIAKSVAEYSQARIFPGDRVEILVHVRNKEQVMIKRIAIAAQMR